MTMMMLGRLVRCNIFMSPKDFSTRYNDIFLHRQHYNFTSKIISMYFIVFSEFNYMINTHTHQTLIAPSGGA